jgi:hypothetical protein
MEQAMRDRSKADRQSSINVALASATAMSGPVVERGFGSVFSAEQLREIDEWRKKRGTNRRTAMEEIIEAGMEAKGIRPAKRKGPAPTR